VGDLFEQLLVPLMENGVLLKSVGIIYRFLEKS